jgi:hypothetical protein
MYPVIRSVSRSRLTGEFTVKYMLIRETHCHGFENGQDWTVEEWMHEQGLAPYNEHNDAMLDLISTKNALMPGRLTAKAENFFYKACYDIDRFRKEMLENNRMADLTPDTDLSVSPPANDVDMLKFGMAVVLNSIRDSRFESLR